MMGIIFCVQSLFRLLFEIHLHTLVTQNRNIELISSVMYFLRFEKESI